MSSPTVTLHPGDCIEVLRSLPDASVDSVVTDPPYGLSNTNPAHVADTVVRWVNGERDYLPPVKGGFMGKEWDSFVPPVAVWDECYRVLKPGGHVLAFAGSRTHDLMTLGIRLAGFDIRDSIAWLYGSGMPKSLDVSKAIDKAAGAEREVVGVRTLTGTAASSSAHVGNLGGGSGVGASKEVSVTAPATPEAEQWQGWGTALKPAFEPVVVARKPLSGTVAATVLAHGTGALNIDACRVEGGPRPVMVRTATEVAASSMSGKSTGATSNGETTTAGRWPANVLLDDTQAAELGDPAKFFPTFRYRAKAPSSERPKVDGVAHPTVKPLELMRWLVRLVTPPGGVVLEPFAGSGTTVEACLLEGLSCIAVERSAEYLPLIEHRIHRTTNNTPEG